MQTDNSKKLFQKRIDNSFTFTTTINFMVKSELAFQNVLKDNKVFISKQNNDNTSLFVVSPVLKFGYVVDVL